MATKKKLLQAAAGSAGGAGGLNVEEVFSTYLYEATGTTNIDIVNGVDLDGEGGLVWLKARTEIADHCLFDTERGANKDLNSNNTSSENTDTNRLNSFNSDGFQVGTDNTVNNSGDDYVSWTFRKAPKFFDCVKYTGTSANQTINHNLDTTVGAIFIKSLDSSRYWWCTHRGLNGGTNWWQYDIHLNDTLAEGTESFYAFMSEPSSTSFTLRGGKSEVNANGENYVAYIFAHNDSDGDFGPDGDADIIKCGSYTGNGSTGVDVDLGFEPQWLLVKSVDTAYSWWIVDSMRGCVVGGDDAGLKPNDSGAEQNPNLITLTPTGFTQGTNANTNRSGDTFIYIAIRRGPMAVPESGTDIYYYATQDSASPGHEAPVANWPVDFAIKTKTSGVDNRRVATRLLGKGILLANSTAAFASNADYTFDYQNGFFESTAAYSDRFAWMFRRGYKAIDVVAYSGNGTAGRTVSHNLGVAPEMIWVKARDQSNNWPVFHKDVGIGFLDSTSAFSSGSSISNPTDTTFSVAQFNSVNGSSYNYIAYLFASLDGVSKVGSYTGNGSNQTINCGFSSGARFVLIKRTDSTGDWYVWDTERGIVAGNDPYLELNTTDAEVTSTDWVDPDSSGFIVNGTTINASSAEYIFYAVA